MKRRLYFKFLLAYIILAVGGFILISTVGAFAIEHQLKETHGEELYREAIYIASEASDLYDTTEDLQNNYRTLATLARYQDTKILILNSSGVVLFDSDFGYYDVKTDPLQEFDPTAMGNRQYDVNDFYGYFDKDMVNVMVPITKGLTTKGYVSIHLAMDSIVARREQLLIIVYALSLVLFLMSLGILGLFAFSVYRPLTKITQGANEYAIGNLKHNIPVDSSDEMGYLATALNYMSTELDKMGEYQRKFVANVSHDFRSPLTSIKGFIEAIMDGTIPHEMQDRYLKIVVDETERLDKLTRSLLTLDNLDAKGHPLHIVSFDINDVIKNTAASFEGTCRKKRITIEVHLAREQLFVNGDIQQIQQVLYNLIDNAIKFSYTDSVIKLDTSEKYDTVFVSVKDSGIGIPKESLNKIWERFYKQDSSRGKDRKGTGLGLSIVKEIIHAHNQNINVISTEGVGTEFIFTLAKSK